MSAEYPRVVSKKATPISPWVTLVEKLVRLKAGEPPQVYHFLAQAPYVGVFAVTADGLIPLVRQFRPSVEEFTWEFPAGTLEDGETPEAAARRELREETGFGAEELVNLGSFIPDSGRLQVDSHAFFARTARRAEGPVREAGIEVRLVTFPELHDMMRAMEFRHQLHWAIYGAAMFRGLCSEYGL